MLRHLAGVAEIVEDLDAAIAFYEGTLGLEVTQRMEDDYAMLSIDGVLHFGLWARAAAAESVYGSRDQADRIPLGFTVEFEVDRVDDSAGVLSEKRVPIEQQPRMEPWGQKSLRLLSPGGSLLGLAETPWARQLKTRPEGAESSEPKSSDA